MKKLAVLLLALLLVAPAQADDNPHVWLDTDFGPIIVELYPDKAPITVENFLAYVNEGFYDGLIFHRVVRDRKSARLNSSHVAISYAVFCLKKKRKRQNKRTRNVKRR